MVEKIFEHKNDEKNWLINYLSKKMERENAKIIEHKNSGKSWFFKKHEKCDV